MAVVVSVRCMVSMGGLGGGVGCFLMRLGTTSVSTDDLEVLTDGLSG